MTKEQLLALKPYPERKINSQWPVPEVSVEAKRVIMTHHDLQKREATMTPYPYYPYNPEDRGLKRIKGFVSKTELDRICLNFKEIREIIVTFIPDGKYQYLPKYHISLYEECDLEDLQNKINLYIEETLGEDALPGYYEFTYEPFPRTDDGKINTTLVAENDLKQYEENKKMGNTLKKVCK